MMGIRPSAYVACRGKAFLSPEPVASAEPFCGAPALSTDSESADPVYRGGFDAGQRPPAPVTEIRYVQYTARARSGSDQRPSMRDYQQDHGGWSRLRLNAGPGPIIK